MRLSPIDTTDPPYPVGTVVRLRAVSAWAGHDPGARPIACQYVEDGGGFRSVYWSAELDKHVGRAFVVVAGPVGLPVVRPADRPDCDGGWSLHPDWLEATVPDDPAGPPCLCDRWELMHRGCSPRCGRMQRERAARGS